MKRMLLLLTIISILLLLPFLVKAESGFLYDVLKNEAEANGLAKEYTGEHRDSLNIEPSKKIYHWYAISDEEGAQVNNKNNVIIGGFCWQMIRTTDTGGVKIMYTGKATNNNCENASTRAVIYSGAYSIVSPSPVVVGYMYYNNQNVIMKDDVGTEYGRLYANNVTYSNGMYTLVDTQNRLDVNHHYTCGNSSETCENVYYFFYYAGSSSRRIVKLTNGTTIEGIFDELFYGERANSASSTMKTNIESWFRSNFINNLKYLEDVVYCNDRTIKDYGAFNPNGGSYQNLGEILTFTGLDEQNPLKCSNIKDMFSVSNQEAKITYPVALATAGEMSLLNNNIIRAYSNNYFLLTPSHYTVNNSNMYTIQKTGTFNSAVTSIDLENYLMRPVVSLVPNIKYASGNGSLANPYIIKEYVKSNVISNNDNTKGTLTISNTNSVEENSTVSFQIDPKEGYLLSRVELVDANNNTIEYSKNENEYSFVMPDSNVTITPIYERAKNSVNVEIVNETENITVEINDLTHVAFGEEVRFNVVPITGYKVKSIRIIDENNNEMDFIKQDNEDIYTFIMPATNVTIIPSYERVSNAVNIIDVPGTKEIVVEVNDAKAVLYEEKVVFIVNPEDGYEVESIEILDKEGNKIEYKKTNNENEYEFIMPATSVTITPKYKKLEIIDDNKSKEINDNPNTSDKLKIIILIMLLSLIAGSYLFKKKESKI